MDEHPDPTRILQTGFVSLTALLSYLDQHGGNATVMVSLKAPSEARVPSVDETKRLASELIARAERATGSHVARSNIFPHFGRFVIDGPANVIRHVASQPEVSSAEPNQLRTIC